MAYLRLKYGIFWQNLRSLTAIIFREKSVPVNEKDESKVVLFKTAILIWHMESDEVVISGTRSQKQLAAL